MTINKKAHWEQIPEHWTISGHLFSSMKKSDSFCHSCPSKGLVLYKETKQLWQAELPEESLIGAAKYAELSYTELHVTAWCDSNQT